MRKMIGATALAALMTAGAVPAVQAMEMEFNMLTGAVYHALKSEGFDTTNIDKLTLSEIAQIKLLLNQDDMGNNARSAIERILED